MDPNSVPRRWERLMLKDSLLLLGGAILGVGIMLSSASQSRPTSEPENVEMISAMGTKFGVWHLKHGQLRVCAGDDYPEAPKCGQWSER